MSRRGQYIAFDGIDGSGKGTLLDVMKHDCTQAGLTIFDVPAYQREHHAMPSPELWSAADILFVAEPCHYGIGTTIRESFTAVSKKNLYNPISPTIAFALDRSILLSECIIPALKKGKTIISDRCIAASLAYQIHEPGNTKRFILSQPGNQLALANPPHTLILTMTPPQEAHKRLSTRTKQDGNRYEALSYAKQVDTVYRSPWLKKLFETAGTRVITIDTTTTIEQTREKAHIIAHSIINKKPIHI